MTNQPAAAAEKRGFGQSIQALRNPNYRLYWFSGLGMTGAQGIQQLALAWLVLDLTGSAGQFGLVVLMQGLPMTGMALFGGMLADRYDRKRLLQISQTFTFLNLVTLMVLVLTDMVQVWHLYFYAIGLGFMHAVTMPARQALIRSLVKPEEMLNAVALNAMQMHSSRIIWPSLAGFLIGTAGIGIAVMVSATCSLAGILMLSAVRSEPFAAPAHRASPLQEISEGVRYTFGHPIVGPVITLALGIASFGLAFMHMGPAFARQEMGFSASVTGLFLMCSGIGSIVGSIFVVTVQKRATVRLFIIYCALFAGSLLVLCLNPFLPTAFLLMMCFGFSNSTLSITAQTIFQTNVPQRLLGRVVSLWTIGGGLAALSAWPIGEIGDLLSLRWSLGGVAVLLLACTVVIALGAKPLRFLGRPPEEFEAEEETAAVPQRVETPATEQRPSSNPA